MGWLTDKGGRKICLLPLPEQPFRYAPGKKIVPTVLYFEHRTLPVDVIVLQTVVKDEQPRPKISLPGADPIERLPEPGLPLEESAGALEGVITKP